MRQQRNRRTVLKQVKTPFAGQRRVDRHIGGTGLENRQQPHQHPRAALQADGDPIIGLHAQRAQMMGQLVGLLIELAVTERVPPLQHRQGFGRVFDLRLEQAVNRLPPREIDRAGIERHQHLLTFCRRQDRQAVQRRFRSLFQRLLQRLQRVAHHFADPQRARRGQHVGGQAEILTEVIDAQAQRIVAALLGSQDLNAFGHLDHLGGIASGAMTVVEHRTEQRRRRADPAATLGQGQ